MNRFLTVILGAALLSIAVQADPGVVSPATLYGSFGKLSFRAKRGICFSAVLEADSSGRKNTTPRNDGRMVKNCLGGDTSAGAKQAPYDSGIIAEAPGKLKGRLARENHKLGFKHNHSSHPIPCSPIPKMVAQTAATCGLRLLSVHSLQFYISSHWSSRKAVRGSHDTVFVSWGFYRSRPTNPRH
jgi:hypothetical protein